jgi:hypothetical protein
MVLKAKSPGNLAVLKLPTIRKNSGTLTSRRTSRKIA